MNVRKLLFLLVLWPFLGGSVQAQPKKADQQPPIKHCMTPAEAHAIALLDLRTIPPDDQVFQRYLWAREVAKETVKSEALTLNIISRASVLVRPQTVGPGYLLRVDLRKYAPRASDLQDWIDTWEQLQFDPSFNLLLTKDLLEILARQPQESIPRTRIRRTSTPARQVVGPVKTEGEWALVDSEPWKDEKGVEYKKRWVWKEKQIVGPMPQPVLVESGFWDEVLVTSIKDVDVIRLNGQHVDPTTFAALQDMTQSLAPVVEYGYFLTRALTAIQDKGLFKVVYGGLYYDFAGIDTAKKAKKQKATDEDLLFERLGIGDVDKGLTAAKIFNDLRSDQSVAVFRSDVTGKPRGVDIIPSLARRGESSFVSVTHDIKDSDVDVGQHPILNLLNAKDAAREIIFVKTNGLNGYVLFNNKGDRQDEVPPDIAVDRTIPAPHCPRLQPAIGCIRCHGFDGSDGWKPLKNDVKTLLADKLDVFGDISDGRNAITDTIDRLGGKYMGSPDKILRRGRDDYAENVLRVTGPWEKAKKDQSDIIKIASNEIGDIYSRYNYDLVDAQVALRELGFIVVKEQAIPLLKSLLPPDIESRVFGVIPEDPRLAALKAGLSVNRNDWAMVFSFAAARSQKAISRLPKMELKK